MMILIRASEVIWNRRKVNWLPFAFVSSEIVDVFFFAGIDMLKLFVMANSLVLLLTVAWPAMKETLYIVRDYFLK